MAKKDKQQIDHIKRDINSLKSRLIDTERRLESAGLSRSELEKFGNLIARLEHWQNNGKY